MSSPFNTYIDFPICEKCDGSTFLRDAVGDILQENGEDIRCGCIYTKRYFNANIPFEYWNITKDNFKGDNSDLKKILPYFNKMEKVKNSNRGFYINGSLFGTGKTTCSILLLKNVLETTNYTALFLPFSELVILNMKYLQNHYNDNFEKKIEYIKNVDFLVLDDLGKEFNNNKDWAREALNSILRYRVAWCKITIFTSNIETSKLEEIYGGSNASVITGYSESIIMKNEKDYRKTRKLNAQIEESGD